MSDLAFKSPILSDAGRLLELQRRLISDLGACDRAPGRQHSCSAEQAPRPAPRQAQPFYFGSAERPLFGWIHQGGRQQVSDLGLLICSPVGYEDVCSHSTLRHLAEAAAEAGYPALRFDYDGTGDSAGDDTDPARMPAWLQSIRDAASTLREQTGVSRIAVFGIRLGASMALMATQDLPAVVAAILVNPVVEGRRYVRELRALAATSATEPDVPSSDAARALTAAGFTITRDTQQAIAAMRLAGEDLRSVPRRILLLERTDLPIDESLPVRLRQLGAEITRQPFAGYADMLRDPHETVVPWQMLDEVLSWLRHSVGSRVIPRSAQLATSCDLNRRDGRKWQLREHAVRFGAAPSMFGIVSEACGAQREAPVLLLLNSGGVRHTGPNRIYVRISRHLADLGFRVLRLDLPGLGDSPPCAGEVENEAYPERAIAAIKAAVEFAHDGLRATEVHAAGICSGAYHSLKAAAAGAMLRGIVVINPLTFFWKPGMSLAPPAYQDTEKVRRYWRTGLNRDLLRKLLADKSNLFKLAGIVSRYTLRRAHSAVRHVGRFLGIRLRDDLVLELRRIQANGTCMHFIFSATDPGHELLRQHAGTEVRRMLSAGTMTIDLIGGADHTFTQPKAQAALIGQISRILEEPASAP